MAVSTIRTSAAKLTANLKPAAKAAAPAKASKPPAKAKASKHTTPENCAVLNVNPAVIDYSAWKVAELKAEYQRRFHIPAAQSAKKSKLIESLTGGLPTNRSHAKAYATAEYRKAMKCEPCKGWKAEVIMEAIKNKRLPGQRASLTATKGRKLISAAVSLGVVSRAEAKGRSEWKAAEVLAFVAKHRLEERIIVADVA